jgi:hypothetical protein
VASFNNVAVGGTSQVKFGRNYSLQVGVLASNNNLVGPAPATASVGQLLTVQPPFTIEFDITRNLLSSANVSSIRVFNLSEVHRNLLRKDVSDYGSFRSIVLTAGYGQNLPVIFSGNVTQAWSVREGVNFITQLESFDGGFAFANGVTANEFPANTSQEVIISTLLNNLPGVAPGVIGSYPGSISRGNTFNGPTVDLLRDLTGGGFFIDNGKAHCLNDSECLTGELTLINASSGLLGTPVREQTILHFDMIFEPRLQIGQLVQLESMTDSNFNGQYKVISVKHRGMISEAVCGDAITSVGLFYGTSKLTTVGAA